MTGPRALVAAAVTAAAAGGSVLAIMRHRAFGSGRFDLGNMVQAVWATANGHPLEVTNLAGEQVSRLASHFDPILAALAPFWLLWPSPELLVTVQAIVVAVGAVPVFWLARKHVGSDWAGVGFALAYLLYPPVQWLVVDDFHAVALACPLLLFAFWYLDENRLGAFALFAALATLTREEIPLVVAAMGLWYALARRRARAGTLIAATGTAVFGLIVLVLVPAVGDGTSRSFYGRYDELGGSPGGVVRTTLTDPLLVLETAFDGRGIGYLAELILPLAALSLLSPLAVLVAVPELALNLLSSTPTQTSIRFHYTAAAAAPLMAAAVLGAGRIRGIHPRAGQAAVAAALGAAAVAAYLLGPVPAPGGGGLRGDDLRLSQHDRVARAALEVIPANAVVSATNSLGAHLSARRRVLSFPHVQDADWVVVDATSPGYADRTAPAATAVRLRALRRDPRWALVFRRDGVFVFQRRS